MGRVSNDLGEVFLLSSAAGFGLLLNSWSQAAMAGHVFASFDEAVLPFIGGGATFGALLLAGHLGLRWGEVRSALSYAVLGALASFCAFLPWGGRAALEAAGTHGTTTLAVGLPILFGLALGGIYYRVAGIEREGDEGAAFASLSRLAGEAPDAAFIDTHGRSFYAGPTQVRTSLPLLFASGAILGLFVAGIMIAGGLSAWAAHSASGYWAAAPFAGNYVLAGSIMIITFFSVGLFLPNLLAHKVANYFRVTSTGGYALVALGVNLLCGLLLFPLILAAVPSAIAMIFYRRCAGLEPLPLPEAVWVGNKHALVAEDHPLRRYHQIVPEPR